MAGTAICRAKSTRCLKIPLTSTEQVYLIFLVPIMLGCGLYVLNFAVDLAVAIQHVREGNPIWGFSTLALICAPAVVYFALTVSRPDWWMTEDEKIADGAPAWFAMQILQLVAFPLFALYRYAGLIVLATDAAILDGQERTKTLNVAAAPAAIELYFFLQAWFQAAPQAVLQTHLLFREYAVERTHQTGNFNEILANLRSCAFARRVVVHALCVLVSVVVMSSVTASFQRFESQRINGRQLPWAMWLKKYSVEDSVDDSEHRKDERKALQVETNPTRSSVAPLIEPDVTSPDEEEEEEEEDENRAREGDKIATDRGKNLERQISVTPPLPPKNLRVMPPPAPIRGITTVASLPVPEMPAPPRPDSIARDRDASIDRRVNIVETTTSVTNGGTTRKLRDLGIPRRKYSVKGLDEDDPVGKFVALVWWFFFIAARVFALAVFYEFYPVWLAVVLAVHYVLVVAYVLYNAKYWDVTSFFLAIWLGFVYVFCAIEYRVKFRRADLWLTVYYGFVILQNCLMTVAWFVCADWSGFWYTYVFFAILASTALCLMSAGVYNAMLKPKKRRIYAS